MIQMRTQLKVFFNFQDIKKREAEDKKDKMKVKKTNEDQRQQKLKNNKN